MPDEPQFNPELTYKITAVPTETGHVVVGVPEGTAAPEPADVPPAPANDAITATPSIAASAASASMVATAAGAISLARDSLIAAGYAGVADRLTPFLQFIEFTKGIGVNPFANGDDAHVVTS